MPKKTKTKKLKMNVVVSMPRRGEFITSIVIDRTHFDIEGVEIDLEDGDKKNAKNALTEHLSDVAAGMIRIKPLKGEMQRVLKALSPKKEK